MMNGLVMMLLAVVVLGGAYPVSYTHLDVYKRQMPDGRAEAR